MEENDFTQEHDNPESEGSTDIGFEQVGPTRRTFGQITHQGCSTFICGVIILIVVICKIKGLTLKDVTSKWIDYGEQEIQSDLEIKVFPIGDSYTAVVSYNGLHYLINCAKNVENQEVQYALGGKEPEALFLLSDADSFLGVEAKKVYTTSAFSGDYYNNGEYMEDEVGLPNGKLEVKLENGVLRLHYVDKKGTVFAVHFSTVTLPENDKSDVLINSTKKDLSALAKKTYLDNNSTEKFNLKDYDEITIDMINKKVYAD